MPQMRLRQVREKINESLLAASGDKIGVKRRLPPIAVADSSNDQARKHTIAFAEQIFSAAAKFIEEDVP